MTCEELATIAAKQRKDMRVLLYIKDKGCVELLDANSGSETVLKHGETVSFEEVFILSNETERR